MTDLDHATTFLPGADRARLYTDRPAAVAAATIPILEPPVKQLVGYRPPPAAATPASYLSGGQKVLRVLSLNLAYRRAIQEEKDYRANCATIREATWTRSQRIIVLNPKGGVGKTPDALVLGAALASNRGGGVVVWDACDSRGTLSARAGGQQRACLTDVAEHPDGYQLPAKIALATATQTSFADVLGSLRERELVGDGVHSVTGVLDRTYQLQIADTANNMHSTAYKAALEHADIAIVPTTLTIDGINGAIAILQLLQGTTLFDSAVVLVTRLGGQVPLDQAHRVFTDAGKTAFEIPEDPHIAAGAEIEWARLSRPSRLAWAAVGATVVTRLAGV